MNFDELGSGLGSLSLGESKAMYSTPDATFSNTVDTDDMDIDTDSIHSTTEQEPAVDEEEEYDEGNSLIKDIFSPTSLGVRYALKPMKLLMPPPSEPEHDYEFDTSQSHKVAGELSLRQRKEPEPLNAGSTLFSAEPRSFGSNAFASGISANKEPFGFMGAPLSYSGFSPQVHHHHYYADESRYQNQNAQLQSPYRARHDQLSQLQPNQSSQLQQSQLQHDQHYQQQNQLQHRMQSSMLHQNQYQNQHQLQPYHELHSQKQSTREFLPLPWDPRAVPADRLPYVLSSYLQLLVNIILSGYAVHIIIVMVQTVRQDVAHKMDLEAKRIAVQIASCERAYIDNHCRPDTMVPALEEMCASLERCMAQDPLKGGNWASVSAQTIGLLVNSLVEPLSFKFLAVATFAIVVIFACNFAFGYVRAKAYYGWAQGGTQNRH